MRSGETEQIKKAFGKSLIVIKAEEQFLNALEGITDPEKKRKIIGELFIRIFEKEAKKWQAKWLVQGTIYPDVIESANAGTMQPRQLNPTITSVACRKK